MSDALEEIRKLKEEIDKIKESMPKEQPSFFGPVWVVPPPYWCPPYWYQSPPPYWYSPVWCGQVTYSATSADPAR